MRELHIKEWDIEDEHFRGVLRAEVGGDVIVTGELKGRPFLDPTISKHINNTLDVAKTRKRVAALEAVAKMLSEAADAAEGKS